MKREIAIAASSGELWAALNEDGQVIELRATSGGSASRVGEIWLARIVALRPELPAALVDIGLARPVLLSAEDVTPKSRFKILREGEAVVIEIAKDARADKAAGVTMRLSRALAPPANGKPPQRLDEPAPAVAALIAPWLDPAPDAIAVDDRAIYADLRNWLRVRHPALVTGLVAANEALYESSGIADAVEQALAPHLALPGGGFLLVEPTALGVAVDVDSGTARSAVAVNLEAARAIARQIRLRNLSGPMIVGFVGMKGKGERARVLATLAKALARHVPDCQALGWTRLGHVELVRKRKAPSLAESIAAARA
ncbi:MAG TPA: ribonuclease E/G [Stellaceae bacterium]|nr:ribonuclease E/G [Stellaceae bacterium]